MVKRIEAPSFSGDIRRYPSFKHDFITHMVPTYGSDAFALKCCLKDDALKIVQGVDGDFDEMFKRLDIKYGKSTKIVDSVLYDLKKLRGINDGDTLKFINLVDTTEKAGYI